MSAGEAVARLSATDGTPEFDAWYGGGAEGHLAAAKDGLIEPYLSPNADKIPAEYKDAKGVWTGIYLGVLSFCSNTDRLKKLGIEAPTSWASLLDPKLKKNVAMAHPATSGTAYQAVWTQVELNGGEEQAGLDYFRKLHPNILQYSKSGSTPGQLAGRGEVATGIIFAQDCQKFVKEGLTNLKATFPSEGTGYEVGAVSLIKNAKNTAGGKAFVDWNLTAKAQNISPTVGSFHVPTHPDAEITEDMVKLDDVKLIRHDMVAAGVARKELTAKFDAEVAPAPKE